MLAAYRRTGADPPYGDPRVPHGVAMEGWFWRITHVERGTVCVVLGAVNHGGDGRRWGTVGLAAHPGGFSRCAAVPEARATAHGEVEIGTALRGGGRTLAVDLGPDARLHVELDEPVRWPRRAFGGIGAAHAIPGLSQYWHPWLLRARVRGSAVAGDAVLDLDGAVAYAEKNWANAGFPPSWWWGQAHGFDREDLCIAFAGGVAGIGPLRAVATSLVVAVDGEVHRIVRPLQPLRVDVGEHGWRLAGRTLRGTSIAVEGHANGTAPHLLPVPLPAEGRHLEDAAAQHLAGELRVTLRRRGRTLYAGTSTLAGLEHGNGETLVG